MMKSGLFAEARDARMIKVREDFVAQDGICDLPHVTIAPITGNSSQ
jgi:hypothetical protein